MSPALRPLDTVLARCHRPRGFGLSRRTPGPVVADDLADEPVDACASTALTNPPAPPPRASQETPRRHAECAANVRRWKKKLSAQAGLATTRGGRFQTRRLGIVRAGVPHSKAAVSGCESDAHGPDEVAQARATDSPAAAGSSRLRPAPRALAPCSGRCEASASHRVARFALWNPAGPD